MGFATTSLGKYQLCKTIGEGSFAKVKVATNTETGRRVAIKIINKQMVLENKLMDQVEREISTMKLLHHPNIVRTYEVIATKTKFFLVMEYIAGGRLSDKLSYIKRLSEGEARKYFQQLIDAVDYCHRKGVYHRDLKSVNLLLDGKGNLKLSDFGLSALQKSGDLLSTTCGSPSYVSPEVIAYKNYGGAAADVWSCGVILFELLAGYLPFDDQNLLSLYRKISRAEYKYPEWFTQNQINLISRILDPWPIKRITVAEIIEDEWFRIDCEHSAGIEYEESINLDEASTAFSSIGGSTVKTSKTESSSFINAFQLIAMPMDLDLSGLFEEKDHRKIEIAAKYICLGVERMSNSKVKLHQRKIFRRRSHFTLAAEVIEVTPTNCIVEISKSAGELSVYKEFCRSLSSLLKEKPDSSLEFHRSTAVSVDGKDEKETGR